MLVAEIEHFGDLLDKFAAGDLIGLFAIGTVFSSVFMIVLVVNVSRTIRSIRVASAQARMVEALAQAGHSAEEIERIVKSTSRGIHINMPGAWRPARSTAPPAKPVLASEMPRAS